MFTEVLESGAGYWSGELITINANFLEEIVAKHFHRPVNLYTQLGKEEGSYLDTSAYAMPDSYRGERHWRVNKFFDPVEIGGGSNFHYIMSLLVEEGYIPEGRMLILF